MPAVMCNKQGCGNVTNNEDGYCYLHEGGQGVVVTSSVPTSVPSAAPAAPYNFPPELRHQMVTSKLEMHTESYGDAGAAELAQTLADVLDEFQGLTAEQVENNVTPSPMIEFRGPRGTMSEWHMRYTGGDSDEAGWYDSQASIAITTEAELAYSLQQEHDALIASHPQYDSAEVRDAIDPGGTLGLFIRSGYIAQLSDDGRDQMEQTVEAVRRLRAHADAGVKDPGVALDRVADEMEAWRESRRVAEG